VILGAVYMLRSYQQIMLGENKDSSFGVLASSEKLILVIICIVVIGLGVYPKPLNDIAEQASKDILINIK
jgi:NADH-quinone oxidoreductase subunit M